MKVFQILFLVALIAGAMAQLDNLTTPGHFVLDGCSVEEPTYLEFWIGEDGDGHIQHHELENASLNLVDFSTCNGVPMMTTNRCPAPGESVIEVPGAIRYNPQACGTTQDVEGFQGGAWRSLTNLVCSGTLTASRSVVAPSAEVSTKETVLADGTVFSVSGTTATACLANECTTTTLVDEMHLAAEDVTSVAVTSFEGLPVVTMAASGRSLLVACNDQACNSASVTLLNQEIEAEYIQVTESAFLVGSSETSQSLLRSEQCDATKTGSFLNIDGSLNACSRLATGSEEASSLYMWVPLAGNIQSHL